MQSNKKFKPAYRCDVQEWVSEEIMVNGERTKRKRLVRVHAWGVPFLVARAQQKAFMQSPGKARGHYMLIPKHKTPEDINNENLKKHELGHLRKSST